MAPEDRLLRCVAGLAVRVSDDPEGGRIRDSRRDVGVTVVLPRDLRVVLLLTRPDVGVLARTSLAVLERWPPGLLITPGRLCQLYSKCKEWQACLS